MSDSGLEGEDKDNNRASNVSSNKVPSKSVSIQKSPCINVCQLNNDNICMGCYRSMDEIGAWSRVNSDAQKVILENALKRKAMLS